MKTISPGTTAFSIYSSVAQVGLIAFLILMIYLAHPLSPLAFAGLGFAIAISNILFAVANGLLSTQDAFVSWTIGEKQATELRNGIHGGIHDDIQDATQTWFQHFFWLAILISILLGAAMWTSSLLLPFFISDAEMVVQCSIFLKGLALSLPLQILFHCYRVYFQSIGQPQIPAALLWIGNFILLATDGTATNLIGWVFASRFITLVLIIIAFQLQKKSALPLLKIEARKIKDILSLGLPSAAHMVLEGGLFFLLFFFAAQLDVQSLGLQSIVANLVNLVFAVPYGLSISSANEVGRLNGERAMDQAIQAGWKKIAFTVMMMTFFSVVWGLGAPKFLQTVFHQSVDLPLQTVAILVGCFQIADGLQIVLTGILRGFGDTKTAMWANAVGHWAIGLPVSYILGLQLQWGLRGLWCGLALGFWSVTVILFSKWWRLTSRSRVNMNMKLELRAEPVYE